MRLGHPEPDEGWEEWLLNDPVCQAEPDEAFLRMRNFILISLTSALLLSCKGRPDRIKPPINKICYAAGSCFGRCPVFAVEVDSDLTYKYYGANFVEPKELGFFTGKVTRAYWDSLATHLSKVNYLQPDTSQLNLPSDGPSLELILCFGKEQWKITEYNAFSDTLRSVIAQLSNSFQEVKPQRSHDTTLFNFLTTAQGRQRPVRGWEDILNDNASDSYPTFSTTCYSYGGGIKDSVSHTAVSFSKQGTIHIMFPGGAGFTYQAKREVNKIIMYWDVQGDIKDEPELIETFGLKAGPKFDRPFAEFTLENDSTVKAHYLFPDWVRKVNALKEDTVFPTIFVIRDF